MNVEWSKYSTIAGDNSGWGKTTTCYSLWSVLSNGCPSPCISICVASQQRKLPQCWKRSRRFARSLSENCLPFPALPK